MIATSRLIESGCCRQHQWSLSLWCHWWRQTYVTAHNRSKEGQYYERNYTFGRPVLKASRKWTQTIISQDIYNFTDFAIWRERGSTKDCLSTDRPKQRLCTPEVYRSVHSVLERTITFSLANTNEVIWARWHTSWCCRITSADIFYAIIYICIWEPQGTSVLFAGQWSHNQSEPSSIQYRA